MERLKKEHVDVMKRLEEAQAISELSDAYLIFEISRINGEWVTVAPLDPFNEVWPAFDPETDKPLYFAAMLTGKGKQVQKILTT